MRFREVKGLIYDHTARRCRVGNGTQVSKALASVNTRHLKVSAPNSDAAAQAHLTQCSTGRVCLPALLRWHLASRPLQLPPLPQAYPPSQHLSFGYNDQLAQSEVNPL